jgi:MFS family permease
MTYLQMVVFGYLTFEISGSLFQVAIVGFLRAAPMAIFGIALGAVSDRFSRKHLMQASLFIVAAAHGFAGWFAATGHLNVWHLGLMSFLSGMYWTTEFPLRRTVIGEIAGQNSGKALGIDSATNSFSSVLGPVVGGVLLAFAGWSSPFFFGLALYAIGLIAISALRYQQPEQSLIRPGIISSLAEGIAFAKQNRLVLAALLISAIQNLWPGAHQVMLPVLAKEVFDAGGLGLGVLTAAGGVGAVCASLLIAVFAGQSQYARVYFFGTLLFTVSVIALPLTPWYLLALAVRVIGGIGLGAFVVMQTTLIVLTTPPSVRGRVMGLMAMSIGVSPFGALIIGALGDSFGVTAAMAVTAGVGVACLGVIAALFPEVLRPLRGVDRQITGVKSQTPVAKPVE